MNYRKRSRRRKSPLVVKEIIPPCHDKPDIGSRQNVHNQNPYPELFHDMKRETGAFCHNAVIIGNHEVKSVRSLNILEKKPLENYFGGTKGKKSTKRGTKPHKIKLSLSDLAKDIPNAEPKSGPSDLNGTPEMCLQVSTQVITPTKEEITNKHLEYKIYEYLKMREYNDRKIQMQQKVEEENYIKEQEKLAETWVKYIKGKNRAKQVKSGDDVPQPEPPDRRTRTYKSRYFFRSQKFSNDDQGELSPRKVEAERKTNQKIESAQNGSNFEELGQTLEKLVLTNGWESQQRN